MWEQNKGGCGFNKPHLKESITGRVLEAGNLRERAKVKQTICATLRWANIMILFNIILDSKGISCAITGWNQWLVANGNMHFSHIYMFVTF